MSWTALIVAGVASAGGLLTSVASVVRQSQRRSALKRDAELLALLPVGSQAKAHMTDHLDRVIIAYVADLQFKRRDPYGIGVAVVFLGGAGYASFAAYSFTAWWILLAGPLVIFGIVGFVESFSKKTRDDSGKPPHETDLTDSEG